MQSCVHAITPFQASFSVFMIFCCSNQFLAQNYIYVTCYCWCLFHAINKLILLTAFIVMDKTGAAPRSKGFGFVTFSDANDAATCLRSLNGSVSTILFHYIPFFKGDKGD